jgi:gamma-aminobutyric acid type B receptor
MQVYVEEVRDSRVIALCVYNVTLLTVLGVVVWHVTLSQPALRCVVTSAIILFAVVATQSLIFVPKVCLNFCKLGELTLFTTSFSSICEASC